MSIPPPPKAHCSRSSSPHLPPASAGNAPILLGAGFLSFKVVSDPFSFPLLILACAVLLVTHAGRLRPRPHRAVTCTAWSDIPVTCKDASLPLRTASPVLDSPSLHLCEDRPLSTALPCATSFLPGPFPCRSTTCRRSARRRTLGTPHQVPG